MSRATSEAPTLLPSFGLIFYICKFFGVYPHDIRTFKNELKLKSSQFGNVVVISTMVAICALFVVMIIQLKDNSYRLQQTKFNFIIGLLLSHVGPISMMIDQISAVKNQNRLGGFFNRLQALDQNLLEQNIHIDNRLITLRIRFMVALTLIFELSLFTSTYVLLLDYTEWISVFWIFSRIPEIFNTFDKIWFLALLVALKQRFTALNETFEELAERHEKFKNIGVVLNPKGFGIVNATNVENKLLQSLHGNSNKVFPKPDNNFGHFQKRFHSYFANELNDFEHTKIKFSKLCQLHDGICSLAQELSELWCYPMLILMAYGFSTSTALLYFYYCASERQLIPTFFRVAKDPVITVIYLIYIAGKCVSIMYLSWKTSLESKRTGICLHRCAVVVDKNEIYEIVNHLSLKLLNHAVDFSACGFFTLNMRTLYAIIGGISSYLVILIQFNIAGEQIKKPYISPVPKEFFGFENVTYTAD